MPEVVVVGGGPVGSSFASIVGSKLDTLVLEEHPQIGRPVQCTGLVAPRVVEMADARSSVLNSISGMILHFPNKEVLEIESQETKAVVIDRSSFDQICYERALDSGASFLTSTKFSSFRRTSQGVEVESRRGDSKVIFPCRLLVGADGYKSKVGKSARLGGPKDMVRGIQADLEVTLEDQSKIRMFLGREVAPGFFAWMVPCGDFARVGLCVSQGEGAPHSYLTALLKRLGLAEVKRRNLISGAIPIGPPSKTYSNHLMIVGDAAAQTKPLSGGGLYTGMTAASCAASTALEAFAAEDFSADFLSRYQLRWKEQIGKELERGRRVRRVFVRLSDKKLNEIGRLLGREDAKGILASGDIDHPMLLAPALLRSLPSLIKISPEIIGSLIWKE